MDEDKMILCYLAAAVLIANIAAWHYLGIWGLFVTGGSVPIIETLLSKLR